MNKNVWKTRLLIVDDHVILRQGLASIFAGQPDFEVVGEAGTVSDAVLLTSDLHPDLILMDYSLPDGTGLDAAKAILRHHPDIDIVFLTVHESDDEIFGAIRSGARGYLLKNIGVPEMLAKLRGLKSGEAPISGQMVSRLLTEFARVNNPAQIDDTIFDQLTAREVEILHEVAADLTNSEIAEKLCVSVNTVKNHVHSILQKLDVNSRHEAAALAVQNGLTTSQR